MGQDLAAEVILAGYPVGWFAPQYKLLGDVWRDVRTRLLPYTTRASETERRIECVTGGSLEMWSLENEDAGRSRKYARVIVDEAAMTPGLMEIWQSAIRPTLSDWRGDAWFLSTPKGRNDFWQLWVRGQDPIDEQWMSWQMPTRSNPYIAGEEIDEARSGLPERVFLQEYLAEFLEDSAVFRNISEAATAEIQKWGNPRRTYVIGCDWGKVEDYSVFSVIDATNQEQCWLERSNKVEYVVQEARLQALCERFRPVQVVAEDNAVGTRIAEQLRRANIPVRAFTTTNASKQDAIEALMLAFERETLKILPDTVQLSELRAFEAERLPSGRMRYQAPEGMHDDTVMALALAYDGARQGAQGTTIRKKKREMVR